MSIERIKEEAAKADQRIAELAAQHAGEQTDEIVEAEQPEVVSDDAGVAQHAATEDQNAGVPAADDELDRVREDAAKWEQRYRSLDGMIQARDRQIEQLHQLLAGMQQAPAAAPETPANAKLVSEKDEEAFGADLIDLARRIAKEEFGGNVVTQLKQEVADLKAQLSGVAQTTAVTAQERFDAKLTELAPGWRTTDADPAFTEWLQASPTRQKLFAEAARAGEVQDVAYFFNEYPKTRPAPAPKVDARLEKQLAPGKSKTVAVPAQTASDKKQWTRSEIADFYAQGRRKYSPEDYTRLERDVFAAQKEGRVDFNR